MKQKRGWYFSKIIQIQELRENIFHQYFSQFYFYFLEFEMGSSITEAQKKRAQLRKNVTAQINSRNPYFVTEFWNGGSFLMKTVRTYTTCWGGDPMSMGFCFQPATSNASSSHEYLSTWISIHEKWSCNKRITHR